MLDPKGHLTITLTEPVVFLRSSDPSGRLPPGPNDPPALVRGILTLDIVKPVEISTIEAELTCMSTINQPEGVGPLYAGPLGKQKIYSSIVTVFRAGNVPRGRPVSVGPVSSAAEYDNGNEYVMTASPRRPSPPRRHSDRRSALSVPPDTGPSPPYTRVAQFLTANQTILRAATQTPEEPGRTLSNALEGQAHRSGFGHPPSITFSPLHSTAHSNVSSESFHQFSDSNHHDMAHSIQYVEGDTSRHNTAEDLFIPLDHAPSSGRPSRAHSPVRPPMGRNSRDSSEAPTGRSHLRFSLSSVLDAFAHRSRSVVGSEERERGRPRDRILTGEYSGTGALEVDGDIANALGARQPRTTTSHPTGHVEHREHHLLGLGRILGLERMHEEKHDEQKSKEHGGGWREFKPGTYSYPISFLLPPNLPPTFTVPHGSLAYAIKGVAHRPGTFTSKLSCQVPLSVVAAPALGAGESSSPGEFGPLLIQRQWEGKLGYTFGLSSRLFLLSPPPSSEATTTNEAMRVNAESLQAEAGVRTEAEYGTAVLDLTLLPFEKLKIWKLSVAVDQRIIYADEERQIIREDDKKRVTLLEVQDICPAEEIDLLEELMHKNKHKNKHDLAIPLLPTPISPHRSPLLPYISPSVDPSILGGPGPYTLSANIRLPGRDGPFGDDNGLHFTVKHKSSNVRVVHSLRVVLRVERVGDEHSHDHEDGEKKKMFDISVRTPITILSHDSIPEYQMPPRYCEFMEDGLQTCQSSVGEGPIQNGGHGARHHIHHVTTPSSTTSFSSADDAGREGYLTNEHCLGHENSRAGGDSHPSPLELATHPSSSTSGPRETGWGASPGHAPAHSYNRHRHSHSTSYTVSTFHVHAHPHSTPVSTPISSRPPSPVTRYERLVSGLESEAGEAPPSYESISEAR